MEYSGITYISGITQNRYIISCDPCHEDGDHFIVWIKSPSDETIELLKPAMDVEHIYKTIMSAYGIPKKYWGK